MQRDVFILFLPILSVRDVLQLTGVAPAADDAVGGAGVDAEGGGENVGSGKPSSILTMLSECAVLIVCAG